MVIIFGCITVGICRRDWKLFIQQLGTNKEAWFAAQEGGSHRSGDKYGKEKITMREKQDVYPLPIRLSRIIVFEAFSNTN